MINQIHLWQMAVDLCLVTSILVFAFRWMKGSKAQAMLPRTLELEAMLRSLINEADAAGRHLNEQLLRREQNLQRYLGDVEQAEQQLSRVIALSEERSKQIEIGIENCRDLLAELKESYLEEKEEFRRHNKQARGPERERVPSAAATSRAPEPAVEVRPDTEQVDEEMQVTSPRSTRGYSQQQTALRAQRTASSPIKLEKEVVSSKEPAQSKGKNSYDSAAPRSTADIQRVYAAAEVLLKQGQKLEQVVAQTRLPEEEVRMLSQMIEIERDEEERKAREASSSVTRDPRLGALGAIRRQTTTL